MSDHLTDTNVGNIEYIRKADAVMQLSHNKSRGDDEWELAVASDMEIIRKLSSADVAPVVHSRWIKTADGAECENCGREAVYQIVDDHWEYEPWCPHCGAKMDAQREE